MFAPKSKGKLSASRRSRTMSRRGYPCWTGQKLLLESSLNLRYKVYFSTPVSITVLKLSNPSCFFVLSPCEDCPNFTF